MTPKKKIVKKANNTRGWEIGGAITAATLAAAAGAYLLSDKKTKAKAKKWAIEVRKEVVKNAKIAKQLGEKEYGRMVDEAIKRHAAFENLTAADVIKEGKALKAEWKKIQAEAKKMAKSYAPKKAAAKKPVRKEKPAKKARG
jgi:hypothetical protein